MFGIYSTKEKAQEAKEFHKLNELSDLQEKYIHIIEIELNAYDYEYNYWVNICYSLDFNMVKNPSHIAKDGYDLITSRQHVTYRRYRHEDLTTSVFFHYYIKADTKEDAEAKATELFNHNKERMIELTKDTEKEIFEYL